jgi:hypothetical protein
MACAYLLEQPDHYTSHKFKPFYWIPFVKEVLKAWPSAEKPNLVEAVNSNSDEKVVLGRVKGRYVALSSVDDYTLRPALYEDLSLYDWMRRAKKLKGEVKLPPPEKDEATTEFQGNKSDYESEDDVSLKGDISDYETEDEGQGEIGDSDGHERASISIKKLITKKKEIHGGDGRH